MAGKVKIMLDQIILQKSKGNPTIMTATKTKLILRGLNPDKFTALSEDNFEIIQRVRQVAQEMGVRV